MYRMRMHGFLHVSRAKRQSGVEHAHDVVAAALPPFVKVLFFVVHREARSSNFQHYSVTRTWSSVVEFLTRVSCGTAPFPVSQQLLASGFFDNKCGLQAS